MPARAPEPSGSTSTRTRASRSRSRSRTRAQAWAAAQMAEGDGLGRAGVGVAGHHGVGAASGPARRARVTRSASRARERVDGAAYKSRSAVTVCSLRLRPRCAWPARSPTISAEPRLDEAVDVLDVDLEVRRVRLDLREHLGRARVERRGVFSREWRRSGRAPARRRARPRSPRAAAGGRTGTSG